MTISDYSVTAFALLNGARVLAYVPQIRCLTRDNTNAAAVSLVTWTLFSMANAATVAYALLVINDPLMAGVFVLNLLGGLTIVAIIGKKRIFSLPASSSMIASRDSVDHGMPGRLMLALPRPTSPTHHPVEVNLSTFRRAGHFPSECAPRKRARSDSCDDN
jgi:hypothetical protein